MNATIVPNDYANNNTYPTTESAALDMLDAGVSCFPLKIDGSKAPGDGFSWRPYQSRLPTQTEISAWFGYNEASKSHPSRGLACVTGSISGNLEAIDIDDASIVKSYLAQVEKIVPGLTRRLVGVKTPRPGCQLLYRCAEIGRNQGLAFHEVEATTQQVESSDAYENNNGVWVVRRARIETRGEGGYVVAVGSEPRVHRNRTPYYFWRGDYSTIHEITLSERAALFAVAGGFSSIPAPPKREIVRERREYKPGDRLTCGDDYNARGDVRALLEYNGWIFCRACRNGSLWTRPGKERGASASLYDNGLFHVFSSSTKLEAGKTYTPFALYAILECGGNFTFAAQSLGTFGYGGRVIK